MSLRFSWDTVNSPADSNAQYLIGAKQTPVADCTSALDTTVFSPNDGPEIDIIPEWDIRNFTIAAWISLSRLPLGADPSPSYNFNREKFGICVRDCIEGGSGGSSLISTGLWIQGTSGNGAPVLVLVVVRDTTIPIASNLRGVLPAQLSDPTYWMFCAGTHVLDALPGPRLYTGDLATAVSEISAYNVQDPGSGPFGNSASGFAGPSVSGNYPFVRRWGNGGGGPVIVGQLCRPVPANGPNQHYGLQAPTNTGRGAMQGRIANLSIWAGALTLAQLEWVRFNSGPFSHGGFGIPPRLPAGFPSVIANWPLDDVGPVQRDYSGNGHDLVIVGPVQPSNRPAFEGAGSQGY